MTKFLQSYNAPLENKSEDHLFENIVAISLSRISNWEIKEEAKLEIQILLFEAKKIKIYIKIYCNICV